MQKIQLTNKKILITGAAGFIGSNLVLELLKTQSTISIVGIDNMNDYYDVSIKEWRLKEIEKTADEHSESIWTFIKGNIADIRERAKKKRRQHRKVLLFVDVRGIYDRFAIECPKFSCYTDLILSS